MRHYCNETYLLLCLPQIISHLQFPTGSAQGFRKQAKAKGTYKSLLSAWLWLKRDLASSTISQSLLSWGGMVTSTVVTFLMFSLERHISDPHLEEKSSSRLKTSHFVLFGFHLLKRQIMNRMHVFPNHWVFLLLTPPFEELFSWFVSYIIDA